MPAVHYLADMELNGASFRCQACKYVWGNLQVLFLYLFFFWRNSLPPPPVQWARAASFERFLDYTQRHTTVGRTSLDE